MSNLIEGTNTDHGNVTTLHCGCQIINWVKAGREFRKLPECTIHEKRT